MTDALQDAPPRGRPLPLNYAILCAGEAVSKVLTLWAFAHLAASLGPAAFGQMEFCLAMVFVLSMLADFGVGLYGAREIARQRQTGTLVRELVAVRSWLAAASVVGVTAFALFAAAPPVRALLLLLALSLAPTPYLLQWVFLGRRQMEYASVAQIVRYGVFAVLVLVLVRGPADLWKAALAEVAGVLAAGAFTCGAYRARLGHWPPPPLGKVSAAVLRQVAPLGVSQFAWAAKYMLATVLVGFLAGLGQGAGQVGQLSAAVRIILALHMFVALYLNSLLPAVTHALAGSAARAQAMVEGALRASAWAALSGALLLSVAAPRLITAIYGQAYRPSVVLLQVLSWMLAAALISSNFRGLLIATSRQGLELASNVAGAAVATGVILVGFPRLGLIAAVAGMTAGECVTLLVSATLLCRAGWSVAIARSTWAPIATAAAVTAALAALPTLPDWVQAGIVVASFAAGAAAFGRRLSPLAVLAGSRSDPAAPTDAAPAVMETARLATASGKRRIGLRLFLTCWLIFTLHFATNTVREVYPALTLGDRLSFDVSEYVDLHTDLFSMPDGRAFINNNPGASIVGAVPYALARPLIDRIVSYVKQRRLAGRAAPPAYESPWPMAREFYTRAWQRGLDIKFALGAGVMQALGMAPLSALAVVVMYRLLRLRTGRRTEAIWLALLYGLATPVFFRTGTLNQNLLVAHCALFAFALLWRPGEPGQTPRRPAYLPAGLLAGWAVVCDYSGVVVLAVLAGYAFWRWRDLPEGQRRRSDLPAFATGAAAAVAVLLLYQWHSFGSPFSPAQAHMPVPAHGQPGMSWPDGRLLAATLLDGRYGLLPSAPLLALAVCYPAWRRGRGVLPARETQVALALIGGVLLFCSANRYGYLQFNSGVRHIVPVTPLAFLLAAGALVRLPAIAAVAVGAAGAGWSWCLAIYRDVELGWGVLEAPRHVLTHGVQLPWLGTLQKLGYISGSWASWVVLLLAGAVLLAIWPGKRGRANGGDRPMNVRWRRMAAAGMALTGAAAIALAMVCTSSGIEHFLRGRARGELTWGPNLFRALLGFHGVLLMLVAVRAASRKERQPPPGEARAGFALSVGVRPGSWELVALLALCVLATGLRLYRLDTDLWTDEVLTLADFVRPPVGEIISSFPSQNQNMLYSLLAKAAISVGGENAAMVRLPAVVLGVLSIPALYLLGRMLAGPRQALAACALMTVSYHHVWFSQNARGYTGVLLLATLGTWLFLQALGRRDWRWWLGWAVCVAMGMWVHMTMAFVAAAHGLIYLVLAVAGRHGNRTERRLGGVTLGSIWLPPAAAVLAGTLTLQWMALSLPEFLSSAMHEVSLQTQWTSVLWLVLETIRGLRIGPAGFLGLAALVALPTVGWFSTARRNWAAAVAMVLPAVMLAAFMIAKGHNLWPRFAFFSAGFAAFLAVHGAAVLVAQAARRLPAAWRDSAIRWVAMPLFVAAMASSAATLPRNYALPKQAYSAARDYVQARRSAGSSAVAVGLAGEMYRRYYAPSWMCSPTAAQLEGLLAGGREVWVVYTMPPHMQAWHAATWALLERRFLTDRVFPGTLAGGEVVVCRARPTTPAATTRAGHEGGP